MGRIEQLQEFMKDAPADCFLRHALALEYVKLGDEEAARRQFEEVLAINKEYVGSYYHLAKLFERTGQEAEAIRVYEEGMKVAERAGDRHAHSELRSAYEELTF